MNQTAKNVWHEKPSEYMYIYGPSEGGRGSAEHGNDIDTKHYVFRTDSREFIATLEAAKHRRFSLM